jgi:hypothetical protein
MARSFFEALTTPPPIKPPPPKYPLFTKKFHSTTSFSPGHIVGAAALGLGIYGLGKFFITRGQAEAARVQQEAMRGSSRPTTPGVPIRPADEPKLAQVENQRGQYGVPGAKP